MGDELPTIEARLWWATAGTVCCVVAAVTKEDARVLLQDRFAKFDRGQITPCTPAQYRRYQDALAQEVERDRKLAELAARGSITLTGRETAGAAS